MEVVTKLVTLCTYILLFHAGKVANRIGFDPNCPEVSVVCGESEELFNCCVDWFSHF